MDPSFVLILAMAAVGIAIAVVLLIVAPRVRGLGLQRELEAAGVRIGSSAEGRDESAGPGVKVLRVLVVPVPAKDFQQAFLQAASGIRGAQPQMVSERVIALAGRKLRFWNPNRPNPLDFAKAEVAFDVLTPVETRLVVRVGFAGYWRAVVSVGLFILWGSFIVWITFRPRLSPWPAITVFVGVGISLLAIRYTAQLQSTRNFFDQLALQAVRRAVEIMRRPQ